MTAHTRSSRLVAFCLSVVVSGGLISAAGQARSGQARSGQARSGQARSGQARSAQAAAGQAAVWPPPAGQAQAGQAFSPSAAQVAAVRRYIKQTWHTLTRSARDLPRAAPDPKFRRPPGEPAPVYLAGDESRGATEQRLRGLLSAEDLKGIELRTLPERPDQIREHGLLYVPYPYVVPGGRFNEMYGWDSYFIQVGLLRDGELDLARNMTDNFLYEIAHYGMIINANRTYYLTRSQPPFLTEMILGVYDRTHDRAWLRSALPAVERYYAYWTTPPHLIESVGLSRYYDLGDGPAPEAVADERDAEGRTHYDRVREYYRTHQVDDYDVSQFYDRAADRLTDKFYKGDRSMRESGFDPSNRYGPFSAAIVDYVPVCLNALLYRMEREAGRIQTILGNGQAAAEWEARARRRRERVDRFLWDPEAGLYFDYNVVTGRRRHYEFATTFYPLWAGMSSLQQARRVAGNLGRFEAPGGILTSTTTSGSQWDAPFGWAPLQMMADGGLRRYGYQGPADRIARKFISLVVEDFEAHGAIVEKYDVRRRSSDLAKDVKFGYSETVQRSGSSLLGFKAERCSRSSSQRLQASSTRAWRRGRIAPQPMPWSGFRCGPMDSSWTVLPARHRRPRRHGLDPEC